MSVILCLTGAVFVSAQSIGLASYEYFTTIATYVSAQQDQKTGTGTLLVSRQDADRGTIHTTYFLTPKTSFLQRYGGGTALSNFKSNEELAIYSIRNRDGSLTALTVTNNNLWFLDPVIQEGEILSVDLQSKSLSIKILPSNITMKATYSAETQIQKPKSVTGTETDLVVGKRVKVRGVVRKTGVTTAIEQSYVIWILPEHGE
jgi:hypothetical protein